MPAQRRMRPCACGRRPVRCPNCYGSGTLYNGNKCLICNGSGTVLCPDCGGTGNLWDWVEIPEENSSYSTSSYVGSSGSAYATGSNPFAELDYRQKKSLVY